MQSYLHIFISYFIHVVKILNNIDYCYLYQSANRLMVLSSSFTEATKSTITFSRVLKNKTCYRLLFKISFLFNMYTKLNVRLTL